MQRTSNPSRPHSVEATLVSLLLILSMIVVFAICVIGLAGLLTDSTKEVDFMATEKTKPVNNTDSENAKNLSWKPLTEHNVHSRDLEKGIKSRVGRGSDPKPEVEEVTDKNIDIPVVYNNRFFRNVYEDYPINRPRNSLNEFSPWSSFDFDQQLQDSDRQVIDLEMNKKKPVIIEDTERNLIQNTESNLIKNTDSKISSTESLTMLNSPDTPDPEDIYGSVIGIILMLLSIGVTGVFLMIIRKSVQRYLSSGNKCSKCQDLLKQESKVNLLTPESSLEYSMKGCLKPFSESVYDIDTDSKNTTSGAAPIKISNVYSTETDFTGIFSQTDTDNKDIGAETTGERSGFWKGWIHLDRKVYPVSKIILKPVFQL